MSNIRYLCIDDKPVEVEIALRRLRRNSSELFVKCVAPIALDRQVKVIRNLSKSRRLDGIVLDLRLDDSAQKNQIPVDYKAQQLASNLRTHMADGKIKDFPIVLWSISEKLAKSFNRDLLSHDLFDHVIDKEELDDNRAITAAILVSLAKGYKSIAKISRTLTFWPEMLRLPKGLVLDTRIGEALKPSLKTCSVHVIAGYVLNKLIKATGPLVDKDTLCARLGIATSSFDDSALSQELDNVAGYRGPFHEAWPRWWWAAVEIWWQSKVDEVSSPLSITAEDRLRKLKNVFSRGKSLRVAKPITERYSKRFTTVCQSLRQPLDPIDGFMISAAGLEPWQDRQYVSALVALKPSKYRFRGQLATQEKERSQSLRKLTRNVKKKK
jgi:hypothetical protein